MENYTDKIISRIKKERITPIPLWKLRLRNYLFWAFLGLAIFGGAVFSSMILWNATSIDFDLVQHFQMQGYVGLLLRTAPFFWIALVAGTLTFGILALRKTRRGYRFNVLLTLGFVMLAVSILGTAAHFARINTRFDRELTQAFPSYQLFAPAPENRWEQPEEGLLGGEIVEAGEGVIILESFQGRRWNVRYSDATRIGSQIRLGAEEIITIVGKKIDESNFEAQIIKSPRFRGRHPMHQPRPTRHMPMRHRPMQTFNSSSVL